MATFATNGHVTEVSNQSMIMGLNTQENMNKYIKFVVDAGYVTRETLRDLANKADGGDQSAQAAILGLINQVPADNIRSQNDRYDYVIQTQASLLRAKMDGSGNLKWKKTRLIFQPRKLTRKLI